MLTDFGAIDFATGVAVQSDGRIVAVGAISGPGGSDFALARYSPDGSLDPSFGGDGRVNTRVGDEDSANAVAIQADGKIVAAGETAAGARV